MTSFCFPVLNCKSEPCSIFLYKIEIHFYLILLNVWYQSQTFSIWKKKYSIQDSLSCPTHLWEKKFLSKTFLSCPTHLWEKKFLSKMFLSKFYHCSPKVVATQINELELSLWFLGNSYVGQWESFLGPKFTLTNV